MVKIKKISCEVDNMTNGPELPVIKIIRDFIEIKNFMQASNGNNSRTQASNSFLVI